MNGIGTETTLEYSSPQWKLIRTVIMVLFAVIGLAALWFAFVQGRRADILRAKMAQEKRENTRSRRS